jgi:hypothetical protein
LAQLNTKSLSEINQESAKQISQITQLLTDPEKLEKILDDYGINSSSQVQTELEEMTTMTTEFDAGEFLNEVAQAKKLNTPQTILDTRQLTQTLIKRYLHS